MVVLRAILSFRLSFIFEVFFALPDSQSDIICKCDVWLCALAERTTLSGWENESKSSGTTLQ